MSKKSKFKVQYNASDDELYDDEDSMPNRHNDGYVSDDEFLEYPPMLLMYDSYDTATKKERKAERKRRKKMYDLDDEKIEDIYEALGGMEQAKVYAKHLREYAEEIGDWLILSKTSACVLDRCIDIVRQGAEDLEKGVPWIIQYENLMEYNERMTESMRRS